MKPAVFAPRSQLERKPPHGSPCTSCGLCCEATLCPLAQHVFGRGPLGPCPALEYDPQRNSSCGMVAHPGRHKPILVALHGVEEMRAAALLIVGSGLGCDARVNGEPGNDAFYAKLRQWDRDHKRQIRHAKKLWRMP